MSTITLKDIPTSLHRALKARAKAHGRSLNREIITMLGRTVHSAPVEAAAVAGHAMTVREATAVYVTRRESNARRKTAANWRTIITVEPGKRGGMPCIRGMRITVYDVLEYLASGMTETRLLLEFPYLTAADIRACLQFAADREHGQRAVRA